MLRTKISYLLLFGALGVILISLYYSAQSNSLKNLTSMSNQNQTIELVHGSGDVKHAIIWLHGLGATANDFPPIVPELGLALERAIRFIFPQAPNRPITVNGGMKMPGWYDIKGTKIADKEDALGMAESQATLESLIQQQINLGIDSEHIIIAGFSQGGAVVYYTGIRSQHKLAGMLTLSTYLPFSSEVAAKQSDANKNTPIFASHGTQDPMVPFQNGKDSADKLKELGYEIEFRSYPMQHQVAIEQIRDIGRWINSTFSE